MKILQFKASMLIPVIVGNFYFAKWLLLGLLHLFGDVKKFAFWTENLALLNWFDLTLIGFALFVSLFSSRKKVIDYSADRFFLTIMATTLYPLARAYFYSISDLFLSGESFRIALAVGVLYLVVAILLLSYNAHFWLRGWTIRTYQETQKKKVGI